MGSTHLSKLTACIQEAVFKSFTAGELKGVAGRKWRYREGTLAEEKDRRDEEKEAQVFPKQVRHVVRCEWKSIKLISLGRHHRSPLQNCLMSLT